MASRRRTIQNESVINRVYMSRNVILSMLKTRGYTGNFEKLRKSATEISTLLEADNADIEGIRDLDGFPVYVTYFIGTNTNVNSEEIKKKLVQLQQSFEIESPEEDAKDEQHIREMARRIRLIVVYEGEYKTVKSADGDKMYRHEPRSKIEKLFREISPRIEIFELSRTVYNVVENNMVPKHTLLRGEDYDNVVEKYGRSQLSKIQAGDVISKYYAAKPGDIFRIERNSDENTEIAYRLVI